MSKKNNPVIIGAAQFTQRKGTTQPLDSLSLMVKTGQKAIEDTQANNIVDYIDAIYMVNISSWSYGDAPGELGKRLNITPKEKVYLPNGGQTPQVLVNRAAKAIASGEHRAVLISGGEAAAMVVIDSIVRLIPGVLNDFESGIEDSFQNGMLDCPWYTRPENFEGHKVPDVLLSGNHKDINKWRSQQSLQRTRNRRSDLLDPNK